MNKILRPVCRQARFKKIAVIGFLAAFLVVFLSANGANASFWDWFKAGDDNVAATASSKTYTLKTNKSGRGAVTSNDGKINCGSDCKEKYNSSPVATVVLAAKPDSGYYFSGWSGGNCKGTGSCTVKMSKSTTVTARFKKGQPRGTSNRTSDAGPVSFTIKNTLKSDGTYGGGTVSLSSGTTNIGSCSLDAGNTECQFATGLNSSTGYSFSADAAVSSDMSFILNGCGIDTFAQTGDISKCVVTTGASGGKNIYVKFDQGYKLSINLSPNDVTGVVVNHNKTDYDNNNFNPTTFVEPNDSNDYNYEICHTDNADADSLAWFFLIFAGTGTTDATPCAFYYPKGIQVSSDFGSYAADGVSVTSVTGDCANTTSCLLLMDGDKTLNVNFARALGSSSSSVSSSSSRSSSSVSSSPSAASYKLKTKVTGSGTVKGDGVSCKKSCENTFTEGTWVTLDAAAGSGYVFGTWEGDCDGSNNQKQTCTLNMKRDMSVTVTFNKNNGGTNISVRTGGNGAGTVKNTNGKIVINCGDDCSENVVEKGTLVLKAYPSSGSVFGSWSGCDVLKEWEEDKKGECTVSGGTSGGSKLATVSFKDSDSQFPLKVKVIGSGTIKSDDDYGKINCGSDCKETYNSGKNVRLTATPSDNYEFKYWKSCYNKSDGNVCAINVDRERNIEAYFAAKPTPPPSSSSSSLSLSSTAPTATTGTATNITLTSATLNGVVNPKGLNVSYYFSYIRTGVGEAWTNTLIQSAGTGSSDISVSANISGLFSGTSYNYNITVINNDYTGNDILGSYTTGETKSFTTLSSSSSSSSQTTASTYNLKVTVSGNGRVLDTYSKIDCGSNMACQATYSKGQIVTLITQNTDSNGRNFNTKVDSWSGGGCSGTGTICQITMDENKETKITFISK